MLSGSLTPCTATLLASSRSLKSASSTSDEYNVLLPPSSTTSEKSVASRHSSNAAHSCSVYNNQLNNNSTSSINNNNGDPVGSPSAAAMASASGAAAATGANSAGRSAALERAYVHDVYEHCEEPAGPVRPRVAQFLAGLEPGSMVCDVGCGSGRYLNTNPLCFTLGVDRCARLATQVRSEAAGGDGAGGGGGGGGGEVALCDNLELPFRDESFDAVLSVAVVHHFATTERRVGAIRELARVLRIGGRVIITVWALEQKQRRFESQDVLIPWQQPKSRNSNFSDEDDDDDFLPPYHAYTEDSTNSSRSAGDGDSSSLSSSSPGESCYSFVRRAIQKLAGTGRRHPWFLDTWTSKDTKNGCSLDYEDAKDLPIELRRLEDFEDFSAIVAGASANGNVDSASGGSGGGSGGNAGDTSLLAGLKSRSLGSILYPPSSQSLARQIVRSRSSVPSLGGGGGGGGNAHAHLPDVVPHSLQQQQHSKQGSQQLTTTSLGCAPHPHSPLHSAGGASTITTTATTTMVTPCVASSSGVSEAPTDTMPSTSTPATSAGAASRRPRLVKQKQSLCDEEASAGTAAADSATTTAADDATAASPTARDTRVLLRKQSSLNEELMAENRIRERERVKKRIQKQTSLNESHLTRSAMFSRKFQVIRDGLTTKLKSGTGSLERVTKCGLVKIMQSVKSNTVIGGHPPHSVPHTGDTVLSASNGTNGGSAFAHIRVPWAVRPATTPTPPMVSAPSLAGTTSASMTTSTTTIGSCGSAAGSMDAGDGDTKERRHSRESGSDSSKDSLQSDTSIESEDSFASVIFIPKGELQQQQQQQQHQHTVNNDSTTAAMMAHTTAACLFTRTQTTVPTSPLVMPCPTPAHSPAPPRCRPTTTADNNLGQPMLAPEQTRFPFENLSLPLSDDAAVVAAAAIATTTNCNQFGYNYNAPHCRTNPNVNNHHMPQPNVRHQSFESSVSVCSRAATVTASLLTSAHTGHHTSATHHQHHSHHQQHHHHHHHLKTSPKAERITRQVVKNLPPIPKFRKHSSINYPIVRRGNSSAPAIPKLSSMELFNPATDDLDSDSSEPSSPDSIDSVISAFKPPVSSTTTATSASSDGSGKATAAITPEPASVATTNATPSTSASSPTGNTLTVGLHRLVDSLRSERTADLTVATANVTNADTSNTNHSEAPSAERKELVAFAEKLSAHLLKEMDSGRLRGIFDEHDEDEAEAAETDANDNRSEPSTRPPAATVDDGGGSAKHEDAYIRKLNGELKDLHSLREELRERRLMLANLNIAQYQNSSTIEEEDESPRADGDDDDDDDGDGDGDEAEEEEDHHDPKRPITAAVEEAPRAAEPLLTVRMSSIDAASSQDDIASMINSTDNLSVRTVEAAAMTGAGSPASQSSDRLQPAPQPQQQQPPQQPPMESRPSVESWAHSNSTASLDSPSAGGASTHHRYYHVFREGELEALINHHVTSLHIVSSYYERASWCVVAEKVQVWSI